ncbi:MAG TPA: glutamine synthetase family protein [Gammaproteobacteria bacterium]
MHKKKSSTQKGRLRELKVFLDKNPRTEYIDALFVDMSGIIRGKRYLRDDMEKLFRGGLQIPYSVHYLDVTGACLDPLGMGFADGDPDGTALPIPGTLVPVGWSNGRGGQVLMTMIDDHGAPAWAEPRNVAASLLATLGDLKVSPVVSFELEFYLIDKERDAHEHPQPPISPATGRRDLSTQVYGMTELDAFAPFLFAVEEECRSQNVPASVATKEYAPGQFEMNLRHVPDPLAAADHCSLLRYIVKNVAQDFNVEASFMAKPYTDRVGSGMHVHMSLLDWEGKNVFDDGSDLGSETLRHTLGGLMATMNDAMAIFAPNVNAFRRYIPNRFVPVTPSWGSNNRSVAFRIPTGESKNRRFEHRVAGADANPYLVLAAIVAGIHHGLTNKLDPGPQASGNAGVIMSPDMPLTWRDAIARLQNSAILNNYLGTPYMDLYCASKLNELMKFYDYISLREYDWYL